MSWVDDEFERRQKENSRRRALLADQSARENVGKDLSLAWKELVQAIVADLEKFNSQSDRKASVRKLESQLDVHWLGKSVPLLSLKLDAEKFYITYSHPSEPARKLKIVRNDYREPFLWAEGEGNMTFEKASEVLLKPILFP